MTNQITARPKPTETRAGGDVVTLDDKWTQSSGVVLMTGTQALGRLLLDQAARDKSRDLNTAGFVSGYRGSPLGGVDTLLWSMGKRLDAAGIRFRSGVNEELAATAVHGSQQVGLLPLPKYDGVFAVWYGKGPGVDRALDALKHGNLRGASPHGGVLCVYGDDHAGKSSTVAHQSEQAMASALIPSLYPADAAEILSFGLLGFALSRFSGAWIGLKCVNETVEQTLTVDLGLCYDSIVIPDLPAGPDGVHARFGAFNPLGDEQIALEQRLPRVHAFVRANRIDRAAFRSPGARLGIIAAGKSFGDVRQALLLLGLSDAQADALGISLYKVGCIWPLEPEGLQEFALDHGALLIVEEKKSFLEQQAAEILFNLANRPGIYGKRDEHGAPLLSSTTLLEPPEIARAILGRLHHLGVDVSRLEAMMDSICAGGLPAEPGTTPKRAPYFCSGCPHNRSTRLPAGSLSMTGIGCHTMVNFVRPELALPPTQMGGEGASWIGIAPFTDTPHIFQNLGDGTYYHSGLLAIRAAIAAGVNITYKILYNDAVAMTGGQPIDGPISVAEIVRQVRDEGAREVVVVSENPDRYADDRTIPAGLQIVHRDRLEEVQLRLRDLPGTTVIVYEQTCAAEKRRRRKRGAYPNPAKRMFISKSVCEGCGDCSVQSTCVSVQPVETEFGTKRRIDQSSCNKDFSCANGFCPSFITVRDAEPRKPASADIDDRLFADLPDIPAFQLDGRAVNVMIAGIGGTGVVTAAALIGMAAHLDGRVASLFDMTGLAQKNGAVFTHVKVADRKDAIATQRIGAAQASVLLAFDLVAALGAEAATSLAPGATRALVNTDLTTTVAFQFDRNFALNEHLLMARLGRLIDKQSLKRADATAMAAELLGDAMYTTSLLLGVAAQHGLLPVSAPSMEAAIRLNGVAVAANLRAFRLGRLFVHRPEAVAAMIARDEPAHDAIPATLAEIMASRSAHLTRYQNERLSARYRSLVERVAAAEHRIAPGETAMAIAVARNHAKLLAYKDEYEVARLLSNPDLYSEIAQTFGDDAKLSFNMAPPIFNRRRINGRPAKREFSGAIRPFLGLLAKFKPLRGTWADPFGRSADRRVERDLIVEYEALVDRALGRLTAQSHRPIAAMLALADEIRGYGPVKDAAVAEYRAKLRDIEATLDRPLAGAPPAAAVAGLEHVG